MRYLLASLLSLALLAAYSVDAAAHAFLERSQPADGAALDTAPSAVKLWFSRAIEPSFSKVTVVNTAGKRMDKDNPTVNDDEPKLIQVGLKPLPSGTYKVIWFIVAYDSHKAKGEFTFTVQ
jgi:methionine-rich copper-binding protein CopC